MPSVDLVLVYDTCFDEMGTNQTCSKQRLKTNLHMGLSLSSVSAIDSKTCPGLLVTQLEAHRAELGRQNPQGQPS